MIIGLCAHHIKYFEQASNPVPTKQCYKKPRQVYFHILCSNSNFSLFRHVFFFFRIFSSFAQHRFLSYKHVILFFLFNLVHLCCNKNFFRCVRPWSALSQRLIIQILCVIIKFKSPNFEITTFRPNPHQVVTAKIPKQVCGQSSELTKRKTNPTKR